MHIEGRALVVGHIARIPIRIHWSTPLACLVVGGLAFRPVVWAAALGLVLIHELGHAAVVRAFRAEVTAVELNGWGGLCFWRGKPGAIGAAAIAWGGVWAQLVVAGLAFAAFAVWSPTNLAGLEVEYALTWGNLKLAAFNLIPIAPLDGAKAWPLFPALWRRLKQRRVRQPAVDEKAIGKHVEATLKRITDEVNAASINTGRDKSR